MRIPIDRVVPMEQAAAAHRHAENGARGKIVIDMSDRAAENRSTA